MVVARCAVAIRVDRRTRSRAVTARGCLPPAANVCVAAPCQSDQFCNRGIFRIWDMGCEPTLGVPSSSLHLTSSPFLSSTVPFPTIPLHSLRSRPLNPAKMSGERLVPPAGPWAEPHQPKLNLAHFSLKSDICLKQI